MNDQDWRYNPPHSPHFPSPFPPPHPLPTTRASLHPFPTQSKSQHRGGLWGAQDNPESVLAALGTFTLIWFLVSHLSFDRHTSVYYYDWTPFPLTSCNYAWWILSSSFKNLRFALECRLLTSIKNVKCPLQPMTQQAHASHAPPLLEKRAPLFIRSHTQGHYLSMIRVTEKRKQCSCPSVGEWLNKGWYILSTDAVIPYKLTGKGLQEMLSEKTRCRTRLWWFILCVTLTRLCLVVWSSTSLMLHRREFLGMIM